MKFINVCQPEVGKFMHKPISSPAWTTCGTIAFTSTALATAIISNCQIKAYDVIKAIWFKRHYEMNICLPKMQNIVLQHGTTASCRLALGAAAAIDSSESSPSSLSLAACSAISSSKSLLSMQRLWRMQQPTMTFGIRSIRCMSRCCRRRYWPLRSANALSITHLADDKSCVESALACWQRSIVLEWHKQILHQWICSIADYVRVSCKQCGVCHHPAVEWRAFEDRSIMNWPNLSCIAVDELEVWSADGLQQHRVLPLPVDISIRVYAGCLDVDMTSVIFTYFVIFST